MKVNISNPDILKLFTFSTLIDFEYLLSIDLLKIFISSYYILFCHQMDLFIYLGLIDSMEDNGFFFILYPFQIYIHIVI